MKPVVLNVKGLRLAFVAFCEFPPPKSNGPTMATLSELRLRAAIQAARKVADIVVVSLHWGVEGSQLPTDGQLLFAKIAAVAGADLVLGHHPHIFQPVQLIRGPRKTLVAYSLGNFVFDASGEQSASGILICRLTRGGIVGASIVPVKIVHCQPRKTTPVESNAMWRSLGPRCRDLGTTLIKTSAGFAIRW